METSTTEDQGGQVDYEEISRWSVTTSSDIEVPKKSAFAAAFDKFAELASITFARRNSSAAEPSNLTNPFDQRSDVSSRYGGTRHASLLSSLSRFSTRTPTSAEPGQTRSRTLSTRLGQRPFWASHDNVSASASAIPPVPPINPKYREASAAITEHKLMAPLPPPLPRSNTTNLLAFQTPLRPSPGYARSASGSEVKRRKSIGSFIKKRSETVSSVLVPSFEHDLIVPVEGSSLESASPLMTKIHNFEKYRMISNSWCADEIRRSPSTPNLGCTSPDLTEVMPRLSKDVTTPTSNGSGRYHIRGSTTPTHIRGSTTTTHIRGSTTPTVSVAVNTKRPRSKTSRSLFNSESTTPTPVNTSYLVCPDTFIPLTALNRPQTPTKTQVLEESKRLAFEKSKLKNRVEGQNENEMPDVPQRTDTITPAKTPVSILSRGSRNHSSDGSNLGRVTTAGPSRTASSTKTFAEYEELERSKTCESPTPNSRASTVMGPSAALDRLLDSHNSSQTAFPALSDTSEDDVERYHRDSGIVIHHQLLTAMDNGTWLGLFEAISNRHRTAELLNPPPRITPSPTLTDNTKRQASRRHDQGMQKNSLRTRCVFRELNNACSTEEARKSLAMFKTAYEKRLELEARWERGERDAAKTNDKGKDKDGTKKETGTQEKVGVLEKLKLRRTKALRTSIK